MLDLPTFPGVPGPRPSPDGSRRANASVVGVVLLVLAAVTLTGMVGVALAEVELPAGSPNAVLDLSADAETDRIELTHRAGDDLDVRTLDLRVSVDDEPLAHQPPVPFFSAYGFESGPTGAFNPAADPDLTRGETASFALASTNDPTISPGSEVEVEIYVNDRRVAALTTSA